jgi:hypothetical protein
MTALRNPSPRPELLVGSRVTDPQGNSIGLPGPFGRARVVSALPLADGPRQLVAPLVVHDAGLGYLADPQGNLLGAPGVWVSRMITARWVGDTRRLGA